MIKRFDRKNMNNKPYASVVVEADEVGAIIIGAFQIVKFELKKWYAVESYEGEKFIVQCIQPSNGSSNTIFVSKDGSSPRPLNIKHVYWECDESYLFSETFEPHKV